MMVEYKSVSQVAGPGQILDIGDLELPPLESFLGSWPPDGVDCGSLATSLELDNDVLPSTPLTEEQMLQQQQANDEQVCNWTSKYILFGDLNFIHKTVTKGNLLALSILHRLMIRGPFNNRAIYKNLKSPQLA